MDCRVVPIVLARYARSSSAISGVSPEDIAEAWAHVSQCRTCQQKLASLEEAVVSLDESEIPCAECRERLPEYLDAQDIDREQDPYLQAVANHLTKCSSCAAEYEELLALVGQLQPAAITTQRLPAEHNPRDRGSAVWLPLTDKLVRLSQPIYLLCTSKLLPSTGLRQLKDSPIRGLSPAFALKYEQAAGKPGVPAIRLDLLSGMNLTTRMTHSESGGLLTITVAVEFTDSGHPAVGSQVGLYYPDGMPRETRLIEEDSPSATFSRIRVGENYHLRIGYGSSHLDIPLDLSTRDS